jgi:type II secretory pathway component GspD/PulD (secretin)
VAGFQEPTADLQPGSGGGASSRLALALGLALVLACGGLHKATAAFDSGRYDDALTEYNKALDKDPNNLEAKIGYRRTAPLAAEQHLVKARTAQKHGETEVETKEVGMAAVLDPANAVAQDWLNRLAQAAERSRARVEAEESLDAARLKGEGVNGLPINPRSLEGMDLNFTRKTSFKEIIQQLSRNSGVNILLHASASAQDMGVSIDLRGLTFQKVLDALMLQTDMFYRVMDPNTIMVFKKTPANLNEYENKLIQTFYLSNAEVDNVRQIFNALMPQMRVFSDKRLNSLTVLAKAGDLAVARRIVNQVDKAKAEVMIYMELLEVSERTAESLGLLPTNSPTGTQGIYSIGATSPSLAPGNQPTAIRQIRGKKIALLMPSFRLDLAKSTAQTRLLADPNVRVVSGETGEVNIGNKISTTQSSIGPPTTTSATPGSAAAGAATLAGTLATQTTYSYEDVGVRIKVKPRVHFNGDITLELESDVKTQVPGGDPGRPTISQRVIKTTARLRDGETAIFAGLLKEDEVKNLQGLWGISSIPVLSDLLGHRSDVDTKTDVILSIRAVVVRTADLAEDDFEPFDPDQAPGRIRPFAPRAPKGPPSVPPMPNPAANPIPNPAYAPPPQAAPPAPLKPQAAPAPAIQDEEDPEDPEDSG